MIGVLTYVLPGALAIYFIYQAARRSIFLLGIPFLQVMRESIFFGTVRPFWVPGRFVHDGVIILGWIALAWAWCAYRSNAGAQRRSAVSRWQPVRILGEEYLLLALAALVVGKLMWGAAAPTDTGTLLAQFEPWPLLLAGYWLIRDVVRRSTPRDVAAFLYAVAVVTGVSAVLFILHQGLRVPIYQIPEYVVLSFQGQVLTRTFWFMPAFLLSALAVVCARRSWNAAAVALVVVIVLAVVVSYTRALVLGAAAVIAVILLLRFFKERRGSRFLRRLSTVGAALALTAVILMLALPTPTSYFLTRVGTLAHASTVAEDPNVMIRQSDLASVAATVLDRYALFGGPFGVTDDVSQMVDSRTPDSTWVGLIYWTGFLGVAIFGAIFICFGLRALQLFRSSNETTEFLGAAYFAAIVGMFATTFAGWTFLNSFTYPMGLWLFAFVAGGAARRSRRGRDPERHPSGKKG